MQLDQPIVWCAGIQNRFLIVLVAVGTNIMGRFQALAVRFQFVDENSGGNFFKFVSLLLSVPRFHTTHFFFKRSNTLNQRRAFLIRSKCCILGVEDCGLKFNHL